MAASNIGSSKYPLAKIPAMADPADIQVALKYYHWGQEAEPEGTATAGISKYLDDIDTRIDGIDTEIDGLVLKTIIDAKGDLLVGTGNDAVDNLTVGSPGYILSTNTGTATGLEWIAPVQLSDSTSTTSSTIAATSTAVKTVQDSKSALNFTIDTKTADYSLVSTDAYKIIEMNLTSTPNTITVPNSSTQTFAEGSQITIIQTGSGQTTISGAGGVTINGTPGLKLRGQWSSCTLIKRAAANTWVVIGDLSA
jgi:hypothetical protein